MRVVTGAYVHVHAFVRVHLVVVLPDLLRDEPSLVLVVNGKTRIQVDLIHEVCNMQIDTKID